jgi:chromosome segregation ATPase
MSSEYTGDFAQMLQELTVREMEIARLKDMLERTEAQIHEDGGFIDQVVALEEENGNLLARIITLEESVEYLRTSRAEARAERDGYRNELESLRDDIASREGYDVEDGW